MDQSKIIGTFQNIQGVSVYPGILTGPRTGHIQCLYVSIEDPVLDGLRGLEGRHETQIDMKPGPAMFDGHFPREFGSTGQGSPGNDQRSISLQDIFFGAIGVAGAVGFF